MVRRNVWGCMCWWEREVVWVGMGEKVRQRKKCINPQEKMDNNENRCLYLDFFLTEGW